MYLNCQNLMFNFIFWSDFSFLHSTCHFDHYKLLYILELGFCSSKRIQINSSKIFFLSYRKNIFCFFYTTALQNPHISLYILNICFNKIFILLYIYFYYFLHTLSFSLEPSHTLSLSLSLSLSKTQHNPKSPTTSHHQRINPHPPSTHLATINGSIPLMD